MPLYSYEAADKSGKKVKDKFEAADEAALKAELAGRGLIPLSIQTASARRPLTRKRVTRKDLLVFTQELGSLIDAGLPLDKALYVLAEHAEKEALRAIVREIVVDVQRGQSLSQALSKHRLFPKVYVNMVRAGEMGGILETVMKRLAAFLETTVAFREEITSALIYPALLTVVGISAVTVLMIYVVPKFAGIFADMGQPLPLPTEILVGVSNGFISYWWIAVLILALSALAARGYAKTPEGRLMMDGLKLKVPVLSGLHLKFVIARFSRTLGTLLQSGVPILDAVRVSREVLGNEVVSRKLSAVDEGIRKGRGLAAPLSESGVFPSIVVQMVAVGEEAGRLEETFLMVADRFEAESRSLIKRTVSVFEPAMILIMGLIVGFIVISMLIAVFSIHEIPI